MRDQLIGFSGQVGDWVGRQIVKLSGSPVQPESKSSIPVESEMEILEPKTPKLSQAWEQFVACKSWAEKRTKDNQRVFDNLLFFIRGVPVEQVTKADLKAVFASIAGMPQRNLKRYKGLSLEKLTLVTHP